MLPSLKTRKKDAVFDLTLNKFDLNEVHSLEEIGKLYFFCQTDFMLCFCCFAVTYQSYG
jgi:hypothetical protein